MRVKRLEREDFWMKTIRAIYPKLIEKPSFETRGLRMTMLLFTEFEGHVSLVLHIGENSIYVYMIENIQKTRARVYVKKHCENKYGGLELGAGMVC